MIPYGRQDITENDIEEVIKILRSDNITQGSEVPKFEQKLCEYTKAKYAVAVNSCTSALHIACLALGLGEGDILWTSAITFVASANCAHYCGATVDFVDIEIDTALISIEKLKYKLELAEKNGKLPKIVVPVHFAGQPCDMKEIHTLGEKYGFSIIEDAAHAIGSNYDDSITGSCQYSDITVFSFHPVKIITTGEGGVAMTNSSSYAEKMELLRSHGITRDPNKMHNNSYGNWYYEQIDLGFNYRMTDMQAALGRSQLNRLDEYVLRRSEIAKWYDSQLEGLGIDLLTHKSNRDSAHHLYVIMAKGGADERSRIYNNFQNNGIGVNLHYLPVYNQPYYNLSNRKKEFAMAENYSNRALSLPIYPTILPNELNYIVKNISDYMIKDC